MRRWLWLACLVSGLSWGMPMQARSAALRVYASSPGRAVILIRVRAEATPTDRVVAVGTDTAAFSRQSLWEVDQEGLQHYFVEWRQVPEGTYTILAAIGDGVRWRARAQTTIIL